MIDTPPWSAPELRHRLNEHNQPTGEPIEHWSPRPRPPREPAQGRYCRIEPFDVAAHGDALYDAFARDTAGQNWTYLGYGPFDSRDAFLDWSRRECNGDDPLFHTLIDVESGRPTGLASYLRIDPVMGVIEVGHIHLSPLMQGTRLATEAMYLLMRRAFDELGYRRYEWKCDALNAPSCRAAERLGFRFEGIFRQAMMYKGRNRDTAWFSMLDGEWPRIRARFEAWLDPDNFDESGVQRRSLAQCGA